MESAPSFRFLGNSDHDGVGKASDQRDTCNGFARGFCKRGEPPIVLAEEAFEFEQYLVRDALFRSASSRGKPRYEPCFPQQRLQSGPAHTRRDFQQQQRGVISGWFLL